MRLRTQAEEPPGRLVDYTIRWFVESGRNEAEVRALGLLLVREVFRTASDLTGSTANLPEELNRLLVYVEKDFHWGPGLKTWPRSLDGAGPTG